MSHKYYSPDDPMPETAMEVCDWLDRKEARMDKLDRTVKRQSRNIALFKGFLLNTLGYVPTAKELVKATKWAKKKRGGK